MSLWHAPIQVSWSSKSCGCISALTDTSQHCRSDFFSELWQEVKQIRLLQNHCWNNTKKRTFQAPDSLMIVRPSTEMCFKKYSIVSQLNCRSTFKKKPSLNPQSVCSLTFKSNIKLLKHEVHQTEQLLERKEKSEIAKPSTHVDFVVFLEP